MIERLIYRALTEGIAELVANPQAIDVLCRTLLQLDETETAAVRAYFLGRTPGVFHSYPMKDQTNFPSYHIILAEERENKQFLDDFGGTLNEDDVAGNELLAGSVGSDIRTSIYRFTYHILVATENPDTTIYLYQIGRYLLMNRRHFLKENGLLIQSMSGADLAPDPNYAPSFVFMRRLTLECDAEQAIYDMPIGRIRSVDGIAVNDGIITEVLTNVSTYTTTVNEDESST